MKYYTYIRRTNVYRWYCSINKKKIDMNKSFVIYELVRKTIHVPSSDYYAKNNQSEDEVITILEKVCYAESEEVLYYESLEDAYAESEEVLYYESLEDAEAVIQKLLVSNKQSHYTILTVYK